MFKRDFQLCRCGAELWCYVAVGKFHLSSSNQSLQRFDDIVRVLMEQGLQRSRRYQPGGFVHVQEIEFDDISP